MILKPKYTVFLRSLLFYFNKIKKPAKAIKSFAFKKTRIEKKRAILVCFYVS